MTLIADHFATHGWFMLVLNLPSNAAKCLNSRTSAETYLAPKLIRMHKTNHTVTGAAAAEIANRHHQT